MSRLGQNLLLIYHWLFRNINQLVCLLRQIVSRTVKGNMRERMGKLRGTVGKKREKVGKIREMVTPRSPNPRKRPSLFIWTICCSITWNQKNLRVIINISVKNVTHCKMARELWMLLKLPIIWLLHCLGFLMMSNCNRAQKYSEKSNIQGLWYCQRNRKS